MLLRLYEPTRNKKLLEVRRTMQADVDGVDDINTESSTSEQLRTLHSANSTQTARRKNIFYEKRASMEQTRCLIPPPPTCYVT